MNSTEKRAERRRALRMARSSDSMNIARLGRPVSVSYMALRRMSSCMRLRSSMLASAHSRQEAPA